MRVHGDLTQQQNDAVHFVFKILLDVGQDVYIFKNLFFGLYFKMS